MKSKQNSEFDILIENLGKCVNSLEKISKQSSKEESVYILRVAEWLQIALANVRGWSDAKSKLSLERG